MTLAERQTSANRAPDERGYCALALRTLRLWLICLSLTSLALQYSEVALLYSLLVSSSKDLMKQNYRTAIFKKTVFEALCVQGKLPETSGRLKHLVQQLCGCVYHSP